MSEEGETLRRAASLMRARAMAATPGPCQVEDHEYSSRLPEGIPNALAVARAYLKEPS